MRTKYLVPILAVLAILLAGVGTAYAGNRTATWNGQWNGQSMMNGGGSMMSGQGMYRGPQTGYFDESRPFDLQFIDQMTLHHQMAITSSEYMISDSDRPELRKLAADIQKSQSGQIDQMREWRQRWYPDAGPAYGTYGMSAGMMDAGTMEQMMGGSMQEVMGGDVTDAMFLSMMIPHHQQAIDMSKQALDKAKRPEIKDLARKIIDEQSTEIKLMKGYLQEIEKS